MTKTDRNFDDLVQKFDTNIYGTSKGRLRHELLLHYLQEHISGLDIGEGPLDILDAGGGTGEMTRTLAALGHRITLNDISEESLAVAREKCREFSNVNYHLSPIHDVPKDKKYDLVICHAVMEWISDAELLLESLSGLLKPNGVLSLSFYNKDAQLFNNMLYGNFHFVMGGMKKRNQVRLTPHSPLSPSAVLLMFERLPLTILYKGGVRCFHDYLKEKELDEQKYRELFSLEVKYGCQEPYMWLGKYFHVIARLNEKK